MGNADASSVLRFLARYTGHMQWDGIHDLVQRAQSGDADAWRQIEVYARPFVVGLSKRYFIAHGADKSSSDLAQETLARVFASLASFRGGGNDHQTGAVFRALLTQTLKRLAINFAREPRSRTPNGIVLQADAASSSAPGVTNPMDSSPTPSLEVRLREREATIANALRSLDPLTGAVLELSFFHNLSLNTIVQRLSLTAEQVDSRLPTAARFASETSLVTSVDDVIDRAIHNLHTVKSHSSAAIAAEQLNLTVDQVRYRYHKGLEQLGFLLQGIRE